MTGLHKAAAGKVSDALHLLNVALAPPEGLGRFPHDEKSQKALREAAGAATLLLLDAFGILRTLDKAEQTP